MERKNRSPGNRDSHLISQKKKDIGVVGYNVSHLGCGIINFKVKPNFPVACVWQRSTARGQCCGWWASQLVQRSGVEGDRG